MFRQITIVGVGLIGGSFALALKKHGYKGTIVGCDREAVLQSALAKGVVDRGLPHPEEAIAGKDHGACEGRLWEASRATFHRGASHGGEGEQRRRIR
jgi:hypothetical protein